MQESGKHVPVSGEVSGLREHLPEKWTPFSSGQNG